MRRVELSEIDGDFERDLCWGVDERYLYNRNRKKASVFGYLLRIREVLRLVDTFAKGKRVLDLACAQGNFGLMLAEKGYDVTAVDLKEEFLRYAKKKYTHGQFQVQLGNLMDFRSSEPFDCVLAGEIVEHVAHPEQLLKSASENLRKGGIVVITTPNGNEYESGLPTYSEVTDLESLIPRQFHWGDHLFLYTHEELKRLLDEAGFDTVYQEKYNSSYISQIKGLRYLLPMAILTWLEKKSRNWKRGEKDSTNLLIAVGRKR